VPRLDLLTLFIFPFLLIALYSLASYVYSYQSSLCPGFVGRYSMLSLDCFYDRTHRHHCFYPFASLIKNVSFSLSKSSSTSFTPFLQYGCSVISFHLCTNVLLLLLPLGRISFHSSRSPVSGLTLIFYLLLLHRFIWSLFFRPLYCVIAHLACYLNECSRLSSPVRLLSPDWSSSGVCLVLFLLWYPLFLPFHFSLA